MAKATAQKTKTVKAKTKTASAEKAPKKETAVAGKKEKTAKTAVTEEAQNQIPSPEKQEIISQFQVKEGDTGSPEVQVALLTKRIEKLVLHLKTNTTDNHSRRGLLGIVSKRRRLLNYLEKKDHERYTGVVSKLGLGK